MLHVPILRQGRSYQSLGVVCLNHCQTGEPFVEISQANTGLVRRDLLQQATMKQAAGSLSISQLLQICHQAAAHFAGEILPLGDSSQSAQDYVAQVSATTGLPYVLARRNMEKIATVLRQMETILAGLTRNLDLQIIDAGWGDVKGRLLSFFPASHSLGVVLPSNSPGVHSLWIPAVALKTALILKPGSAEPWTPYRLIQAFIRAGCPPQMFGFYPTDHAGAGEILRCCGRSMLFGDLASVQAWKDDPRVEIHGPGYSKIVIGEDRIDEWEQFLDLMLTSILENSGRSCINASSIWVPARAGEIAQALAQRLAGIMPRAAQDEAAQLAAFTDPSLAERISRNINQDLARPGAVDVTQSQRPGERLVSWNGCSYLLPTIILCTTPEHSLANREFLFPFCSVVQVKQQQLPERLGPSLVVTAITSDPQLMRRLVSCPHIGRLNWGAIPTTQVSWDQPHEGNLFEHLYSRRAFQREAVSA